MKTIRKNKAFSVILAVIMIIGTCSLLRVKVYADMTDWYIGYHYSSSNISFRYYSNYNSTYTNAIVNSKNAWNHYTPVTFSINSNSLNYVQVSNMPTNTAYGFMSPDIKLGSMLIKFHIVLNSETIANAANNPSRFIQSVMTHELGHVLGLKDNPPAPPRGSIMLYNITRDVIYYPLQYDITKPISH